MDEGLRAAVMALPREERAVVVLRFHADLSVTGTAEALNIPEGTVKTRTRRALARLRQDGPVDGGRPGDGDGGPGPDPADRPSTPGGPRAAPM